MALGIKRTIIASATQTAGTGYSSAFATTALPDGALSLFLNVTAAVSPGSLKITPEWTDDNGTTWFVGEPDGSFDFVYTTVPVEICKTFPVYSDKYRVRWDVIGTSYTFGVNSFGALL